MVGDSDAGDENESQEEALASINMDITSRMLGLSNGDSLVQNNAIFITRVISSTTLFEFRLSLLSKT